MKNSVWEGGCQGGCCGLQQLGHLLGSSCPCGCVPRAAVTDSFHGHRQPVSNLSCWVFCGLVLFFVSSKQYIFKTKIKATREMKWPALLLPGREPACVPAHGPTPSPEALGWGRGDTGEAGGWLSEGMALKALVCWLHSGSAPSLGFP